MQKHFVLILLLLAAYSTTFSQQLDSLLDIQRQADPQEKIYVQFDKSYYNPGETIWFKAYLFTGVEMSAASKNFYADLIDESGKVLSRKTSPVVFGGAASNFDIDSNYAKSMVYFRAYTVPMLNGDTSFLYTKALRIITPKQAVATAVSAKQPTLSFMPEGGELVAGLPMVVAFIATNQKGGPVSISGSVKDDAGATAASFQTLQNGMGKFTLTAEAGKTYTATWKDEAGKTYTTPLPTAKPQGITLKMTDEEGGKRFTVFRTAGVDDLQKKLHVVAYMSQRIVYLATVNLASKTTASGLFPTKDIPSGILQITVFDSSYKPVAERVTFVNNHDYEFDADVFLATKNAAARSLNQIEIVVSDTVPANLSLSITDADLNESNTYDDNIVSHMLLTGDLRGQIVNPYYYFFSTSDSAVIHLDLVMLTHGWRRYNWEAVMAGKTPAPRFKESNYLSLSGKIAGMSAGSFSPDLQLTGILQTADSAKNFINLPVNRQGQVFTDGLVFFDNAKLYFNFNKKNMSFDKSMLTVDNGLRKDYYRVLPDTATKLGLPDIDAVALANNAKVNQIAQRSNRQFSLKAHELGNVVVKGKIKTAKEKMDETYTSGLFAGGMSAASFDLVNDPLASAYQSIFQYLQGKVAGLQINMSGGTPSLSWRGGTPALYLNEMQSDADMISSTPVSDIAYVKIFRPGESIASGGGGGVISIYTRRGGDQQPDPNARSLSYVQLTGYSPIKEFYSPDYTKANERDAYDDVRSTLYWNPFIILDKTRKRIHLQFYNNDVTKHFRLVMEGINGEGKLFHVEKEVL